MADIFISYTSADRDWAFWVAKALEALGHSAHVYEWEIKSGDDIYAWMEQRHDAADHVLCIVSDAYMNAPYSKLERNAALWQAAANRPGFVLFAVVEPCRLPTLSDHVRRCELFGVPEDAATARFRNFMTAQKAPEHVAFPGKGFAISNIPVRVPIHFMGREEALAAIEAALKRCEGRVAMTALHGMRGVGKTTLAAAYAEKHRQDYRATWWIRAQTPETMRADLVALGGRLGWVAAGAGEEPSLSAVIDRLIHEGDGLLLIYDNAFDAQSLKAFLPRGGMAQVLITSDTPVWRAIAEPIALRLWPNSIGADYLIARTGRENERGAAEVLSETLGGLPLAHEQAAAYCERLGISFAVYHERFAKTPVLFLDDARAASSEYHDGLTVAKTFALAIEEATRLYAGAKPLIQHAAILAPGPIPLFLFSEGHGQLDEPAATLLADGGLEEAVAALRAFALINCESIQDEYDPATFIDTIRVHRLVREATTSNASADVIEGRRAALFAAFKHILPNCKRWIDGNERSRRIAPFLVELVGNHKLQTEFLPDILSIIDFLATTVYRNSLDVDLSTLAVSLCDHAFGDNHVATGRRWLKLGRVLKFNNLDADAQRAFERSAAIFEANGSYQQVASSLHSLGHVLRKLQKYQEALSVYRRAPAIMEVSGEANENEGYCRNAISEILKMMS